MGLSFASMFGYIAGSSFVLQDVYGISPQLYGGVFGLNALGLVTCSQLNRALVGRVGSWRLLLAGVAAQAAAGAALVGIVLAGGVGLAGVLPCLFVTVAALGFVMPNATALALTDYPHAAGSASALLGTMQFLFGAATAPLVGVAGKASAVPMALMIGLFGVGSLVTLAFARRAAAPTAARGRVSARLLKDSSDRLAPVSVLGNRVLRKEDARFLRGEGSYVENMPQEDALHVTFARSLLAHARIGGVDTSAAEAAPDVVAVFTAADLDVGKFGPPPHLHGLNPEMGRPLIAGERVRFVGEIVAVVVAKSRAAGVDAAELVMVDYDPLPVVVSTAEAAKDEVLLFPEAGTNVAGRSGSPDHDEALFDGCDVVVSGTLVSPRMAPCPLEPRSVVATFDADGLLTVWTPSQTPHHDRFGIAGTLGMDPAQVRVVSPDVGGGFGAKQLSTDELVLAWVARRLGRPVRWTETRTESMLALHHGRSMQLGLHHRRHPRRQGARLPDRPPRRRRRLSRARLLPAPPHRADGERRLRDPAHRGRGPLGRDEHDADHLVPRRRPAGGDADDRARDGHARRGAGDGPR